MSNEEDVTKPSVNEPLLEKTEKGENSPKPPIHGRIEDAPKVKRNKSKFEVLIFLISILYFVLFLTDNPINV